MKFGKSNLTPIDSSKLKEGDVANATLKSFRYRGEYCFATIVADNTSVECIIGKASDYPITSVLTLKGIEVEVQYGGTKVSNGVSYPRFYVSF